MRGLVVALCLLAAAPAARADARITVLMDLLKMREVAEIIRDEGLAYADELNAEMLDGQGGDFWQAQVRSLYDPERIAESVRRSIETWLGDDDLDAAVAFYDTDRGSRIVTLENAARVAMGDEAIEAAVTEQYESLRANPDDLFDRIDRFARVNDLTERNVAAALTANYKFMAGLADGQMIGSGEAEIAADVWTDEAQIRADTEQWIYGFLLLAYQPLPPEDLEAYVAFSETPAGRALNAALFEGYGQTYADISYALGRLVALSASGSDL